LVITEVAPLVEYILSTWSQSTHEQRIALTKFVEREMELRGGALHITKDSGLFEAFRNNGGLENNGDSSHF
jgi:hypothetical protein